ERNPSRGQIWLTAAAVFLPISFVLAAPAVLLMRMRDRGKRRDRRLVCPHCGAFLNNLAEFTGHCHRCGEPALDVPPPAAIPDRPRIAVAEFTAAVRNRQTLRD